MAEIAEKRIAVPASVLERLQTLSNLRGERQYETIVWALEVAEEQLAASDPKVYEAYQKIMDAKRSVRMSA